MQYYNERLPCPKCGKDDEAEIKARYIPRFEHPVNEQNTAQARCFVDCGCGCAFDQCKEYRVFGIDAETTEEQIEDIMRRICRDYYEEKRKEQND